MSLKKYLLFAAMMAATAESNEKDRHRFDSPLPENKIPRNEDEYMKSKGMVKFWYGENYVWALNQKTADKKARKKRWIK